MSQHSTHYAIARIDLPVQQTHGWQVRMQRRGLKYAKFFSDANHGSAQHALAAALNWRDQLLEEIAKLAQTRICQKSQRNRSGVVGVSKVRVVSSAGTIYYFWQATWSISPGKRGRIKFSIQRHGEAIAFQLAVDARQQAIGDQ